MPLVRIRRMGNQFLSCGIPLRPPENLVGRPGMKRLCPKLVPGQVVDVPEDHNILNQECVEIVKRVRPDEILRPWVFNTAEEAAMANPSKSKHSIDDIVAGLAMAEGAVANADEYREKARVKAKRKADAEDLDDEDDDEVIDDSDTANARRSANRQPSEVYDDAKPLVKPAADEPAPRAGRRARSRA